MADFGRLDDPTPHARLLGVGRYQLLVTGAGSGAARIDGVALTPWSADRTEDGEGFFVYHNERRRRSRPTGASTCSRSTAAARQSRGRRCRG